jgi:hypothetical protein
VTALIIVLAAVFVSVAAVGFRRPIGMYRRTGVYVLAASAGALVLALLASMALGPNSGLGLAILLYGVWFLVILVGAAAIIGATARHLLNAARR